MDQYEIDVF